MVYHHTTYIHSCVRARHRVDPAAQAAADDGSVGSIAAHLLGIRGGANALVRVPLMWRDLEVPPHATPHLTRHELALLRCPDGKVAHVHRFRVVDGETLAADLSALALQRAARESYGGPGRMLYRGWHSSVDLFSWRGEAASELSRAAAAAAVAAFTAVADDDGVDGVDASTAVVDARYAPSTTGDRLVAGDDADETATRRTKQKRDPLRGPAAADPQARVVIRKDLTRSWFNVWPPGSGHPAHDHADASIAGVFYAQVPKVRLTTRQAPSPFPVVSSPWHTVTCVQSCKTVQLLRRTVHLHLSISAY